jgi:hypothetical protein
VLVIAFVNGEEEESTTQNAPKELSPEDEIREIKQHAMPGQQTRKDLKTVAGVMLEQVGIPFFSWPT